MRKGITADGASAQAQGPTAAPQAAAADAAVIEALRQGDEEAFTRLVDQHHESLRRIARLYVSSPAIADEVVQDTWLAVIRGIWAFEGRSSLKTWILRILINQSKTRALREGRTVPLLDADLGDPAAPQDLFGASHHRADGEADLRGPGVRREAGGYPADAAYRVSSLYDAGPSPEARLLAEETQVRIRAAIEALPTNQRIVITMRDLEDCSSEEVRNTLGLSETNQRVILHRARSNVRAMLAASVRKE